MSRQFLTPLALPAGTADSSPLLLQSGVNLTTATAGAVEYDGKVIYSTPAGRGVSPSMMLYRVNSNIVGINSTLNQFIFGVGIDLAANTVYAFDGIVYLSKTAGTTSHSLQITFLSSATYNNSFVFMDCTGSGAGVSTSWGTLAGTFTVQTNITSANSGTIVRITGNVSVNGGGRLTPRYNCTSAPGGAYSTVVGSYFSIWPIGAAGANTSVGPWS